MDMRDQVGEEKLKRGWTTGTCATVATVSALHALWTGSFLDPVTIRLPRGQHACLPIDATAQGEGWARATVIKDAGDDPDITHGARIEVTVRPGRAGQGVRFHAGEGVGTVTRPGLKLDVGEPAINPVPRAMMTAEVQDLARRFERAADIDIEVAVPGGAALAAKTLNPRLGILGGLSILGTTGVVIPYSCSSWIHSIHRGIDVARAVGLEHLAASTGSTSEAAVKAHYDLPEVALLEMGDFVGGTLKYLRAHPVARLTIAGGFGKLVKLAQGAMDLHSKRSTLNRDMLAGWLEDADLAELAGIARQANTAAEVLDEARARGVPLADMVAARARAVALEAIEDRCAIEVMIFEASGVLVGHERGW
jgi:cobalt-precorrin-5B (C1)-methyltransferase